MKIINEINDIRNIMGLKPVNENFLINETIIDDLINAGKVILGRDIKTALDSFISAKNIDDFIKNDVMNSKKLSTFLTSEEGKTLLKTIDTTMKNEKDMFKKLKIKAYYDSLNDLITRTTTTVKPTKSTTRTTTTVKSTTKIADDTAKKLIDKLTEDAELVFKGIGNEINRLKKQNLGTNIKIDIDKINEAATKIINGSIAEYDDYLKVALDLQKLGYILADEIENVQNIKTGLDKTKLSNISKLLNKINNITNMVVDFIKGNKLLTGLGGLLKTIFKWILVSILAIGAICMAFKWITKKFCQINVGGFGLSSLGWCQDSPETTTTTTPETAPETVVKTKKGKYSDL